MKTGVEYADWQISVYPAPCCYACRYCWARLPLWQHRLRSPHPLTEARRLANSRKPRRIVVSFTGDPYQPLEWHERLTQQTLEILLKSRVEHTIMILTKNPKMALTRDYNILKHENVWLGTTLTSLRKISDEPYAPPNYERAAALERAYDQGVHTWASIEPWLPGVTDPIEIIKETHRFVDWYVIGRLDYETQLGYPKIPKGWYRPRLERVVDLLESLGKPYHIKKQLKENP